MCSSDLGGRVAAYAWLVFAALNLVDIVFGITGDPSLSATTFGIGALLLLGCGVAYTVGLRPAIIGDDDGVALRNPLRDVRAPWPAVRRIEGANALTVRFTTADGTETASRAWVHQTSPRAQAKAEARARKEQSGGQSHGVDLRGRTPSAYAAEQLTEMRDRLRPKTRSGAPDKAAAAEAESGDAYGTVTWSVPALAALLVPAAALVVIVIVGTAG